MKLASCSEAICPTQRGRLAECWRHIDHVCRSCLLEILAFDNHKTMWYYLENGARYWVPALSEGAQEVVDSYGGWWSYCQLFNFNPMSPENVEEARQIAEQAAIDESNRRAAIARR